MERILASPFTMVASDGEIPIFGKGSPHPRSYGTFARVLGVYVREKQLLSLEDAVRKMTSLPAARVGLADRGLIRPGMKADLAVFDPATIRDRATFDEPHAHAEGVSFVLINGVVVVDAGRLTGARPGRVLRGSAARRERVGEESVALKLERLELETDGGVARVWLSRPEVRNAFDDVMVTELRKVIDDLGARRLRSRRRRSGGGARSSAPGPTSSG